MDIAVPAPVPQLHDPAGSEVVREIQCNGIRLEPGVATGSGRVSPRSANPVQQAGRTRKRVLITAAIVALVALGFYLGAFLHLGSL